MTANNAGPVSLNLLPGSEQRAWSGLRDFAFDLAAEGGRLAGRLAPVTAAAAADLVRGMNCYYSNLIEGHNTRPIDIERALHADITTEPRRRNLQLEAAAHIAVQRSIDRGDLDNLHAPVALAMEIHRRFYELLPDTLRFVEEHETKRMVEVVPGQLRAGYVEVGGHVAPAPDELPSWLHRLDEGAPHLVPRADRLVAIAALHHRLLWIHPFADGNGRAGRLVSHAFLRRTLSGNGLWSVSRGLARHVRAYKSYLARADAPPQGMLDGRGLLSDGRLADFCRFFLAVCLDQIRFMDKLLAPEALASRMREFVLAEAAGGRLDARLGALLERAVLFGVVPRSEVAGILGVSDRSARRLVRPLIIRGLLTGATAAPLTIAFPLGETERLFPSLWNASNDTFDVASSADLEHALRAP